MTMAEPKELFLLNRPDQRPEVYSVPPVAVGLGYRCALCIHHKGSSPLYGSKEAFMCNPVDSEDMTAHFICHEHLPENVVIYDVQTNLCRDKSGHNVWSEAAHGEANLVVEMFGDEAITPAMEFELGKKK